MSQPTNPQQPPPEGYGGEATPSRGQSYNAPPPQPGQSYTAPPQGQSYGPPQQTGQYAPAPATTATSRGRPNIVALILAAIAAVLGILALFVLGWYRDNFSSVSGGAKASTSSTFPKIHDALKSLQKLTDQDHQASKLIHYGIAPTYFSWLGYVLIIAAVVLAVISALLSGGAVVAVKFVAALVALVGLAATFWAIDLVHFDAALRSQVSGTPTGYGDWLKHTSWGAWAMMLAFLLCFIASLLPPKRRVVVEPAETRRY